MASREIPGRFHTLSSTSTSNLQSPASSPVAQFRHDGSGSDSVSDHDRGPSHLIHPEHQFQLGPNTPHGPFWDQNPPPYAHSHGPSVVAPVDVAGGPFGPTDISRAPLALEVAQTGPGARYEPTFEHPGAVFHPPTAGTGPAMSFPVRRALFIGFSVCLSDFSVDGVQPGRRGP